jgi:hypothetical protein
MKSKAMAALALASFVVSTPAASGAVQSSPRQGPAGTVWVGNRGFAAVAAFDAATGAHRMTVALEVPASDVAIGLHRKVYVGQETADHIAVIDANGRSVKRISTASHPHHLEASRNRRWITYGAFGTNRVGVIDTRTDTRKEWAASKDSRALTHASVITNDGRIVYAANDVTHEITAIDTATGGLLFSIPVDHAHELVLTADERTIYVSGRTGNMLHEVDLRTRAVVDDLAIGPSPDTLELVDHDRLLTVGLRGSPAQIAVVRTDPLRVVRILTIAGPGTIAGHQWTSRNGRWTLAAFEGPDAGLAIIDHVRHDIDTVPFPNGGRPHGLDVARGG